MVVPPYKEFIQPIFRYLAQHDSNVAVGDVCDAAARELRLTDDARLVMLTGRRLVYKNRAGWALNWLKRAGLAEAPTRGAWRLTEYGKEVAATAPALAELIARFSGKVEVRRSPKEASRPPRTVVRSGSTPATGGNRKAYRLPARPLAVGGQADVYEAVRKSDNKVLILKRARSGFAPRMRREIEVQSMLQHAHIMPILDWDSVHYSWYVMPRGKRTMYELARPIEPTLLLRIAGNVAAALDAAHSVGNPHRDVKPQNVIELDDGVEESRWVLADWGLTRRAPGMTTTELTETGQLLGSAGFAPPEAYRDAHNAGVPGDIYALGQLIAWATGVDPVPNVSPIVPGPWQQIVACMTQQEVSQRPQSIAEVQQLLSAMYAVRPTGGA
jgi:hypothetical protein